jgi:hypothetical protein
VRDARAVIVAGLVLMVAAGAWTLSRSPPRVVLTSAAGEAEVGSTTGDAAACQAGEVLPRGVSAIRLQMGAAFGPRVRVQVYSGTRILTEGSRAADWTASSVTVHVKPSNRTVRNVKLCYEIGPNSEPIHLYGVQTAAQDAAVAPTGQRLPGRVTAEYLAPGAGSWWTRILAVSRHMGIGRAISGTWIALLLAALVAGMAALLIGVAWNELP